MVGKRMVVIAAVGVALAGGSAAGRPRRHRAPALRLVLPARPPFLLPAPPPPPSAAPPRLHLSGQKITTRQTRMAQAGVVWTLSDRLSLQLSYERTGFAPLMPRDHDDGVLTGVKLGF
jgi:hypothetical protein